jgi:murein DD-endopeptidase MepM/ murein hydrolase activator NlpD
MNKRFFTIMFIPDKSTRVRRIVVPHTNLLYLGVGLGFCLFLVCGFFFGFLHYRSLHKHDEAMRNENLQYRKELEQIRTKVASVETYMERVKRFDKKLRIITNLEDPERQVAFGPLDSLDSEIPKSYGDFPHKLASISPEFPETEGEYSLSGSRTEKKLKGIQDSLDRLEASASESEGSLQELQNKLKTMGALLRATPAIWPAKGWVTSNFGYRVSPFSQERHMHSGIDVASRSGAPVIAPADGIVTFIGTLGGYGKIIVVNHSYGTVTRYGHLSEVFVQLGDRIKRGDKLAAIGNTGRSTGPHLHYEVVINGIPRDPRKYILN